MYESYNEKTASANDKAAWALCQIIDVDAPLRWTRYRSVALCIAQYPELIEDLLKLRIDNQEK